MKIRYISVEAPSVLGMREREYDPDSLGDDEVLMETAYSAVSAGTERAWITGNSNSVHQKFPGTIGYSAAGYVLKVGKDVKNLAEGDRVIMHALGHASHGVKKAQSIFKLTEEKMDLKSAAFSYIATFPLQGIRRLRIEMGESVMVAGLGILGLLAVRFARLSGAAPILAADMDPARRAKALELGADMVFDPSSPTYIEEVKAATNDVGVDAVVEVTGIAAALKQVLQFTRHATGRITLLGCTRVSDAPIDFYREVHLPGITLIGAHTSNRPGGESRPGQWTSFDDFRTFEKFVASGRVDMDSIISRVEKIENYQSVYDTIIREKTPPFGIVFDWKN